MSLITGEPFEKTAAVRIGGEKKARDSRRVLPGGSRKRFRGSWKVDPGIDEKGKKRLRKVKAPDDDEGQIPHEQERDGRGAVRGKEPDLAIELCGHKKRGRGEERGRLYLQ